MSTDNPYIEMVDRLKIRAERYELGNLLSAKPGTRPSKQRGEKLSEQKLEALIGGLSHDNPAVRRQCLELLDAHPDKRAVPTILDLLDDPVPRVRWHALHALECDACKGSDSLLDDDILGKIRLVAINDESERVRTYAQRVLDADRMGGKNEPRIR